MSCNDNKQKIIKGKEELVPFRLKIDSVYFDFNGCDVEFLIGEVGTTDWQSGGTGIVYYSLLQPNTSTTTVVFTLTDTQTGGLELKSYEFRFKISGGSLTEPIRTEIDTLQVIR